MSTSLEKEGWILQNIWVLAGCLVEGMGNHVHHDFFGFNQPELFVSMVTLLWSWEWSSSTPRNTESYPQINCHKAKQSWEDWRLKCLRWWTQTILSWLHRRHPPKKKTQINDWYGRCAKEGSRNCVTFLDPLIQLQLHKFISFNHNSCCQASCQSWLSPKTIISHSETRVFDALLLQETMKKILGICLN